MAEFQTISEFVDSPFGNQNYEEKKKMEEVYLRLKSSIKIEGYTIVDDNYLLHVLIPSESNANQKYDVVVLFFTDDESVKKSRTLTGYYIKLFSNSPSFIYQYAAMYHITGHLIDFLFEKMDKDYAEVMPKNPKEMSYDKSIYCACRYLLDDKFVALNKFGIILKHKKSNTRFFQDIKTFADVKLTNELNSLDKKIDKELQESKEKKKESKKKRVEGKSLPKKTKKVSPKKNTLSSTTEKSIRMGKRIKASKQTAKRTTRRS